MKRVPKKLHVFFDEDCALCLRVVARLGTEDCYFPLELHAMRAAVRKEPYQYLAGYIAAGRFVAVDDIGNVYLDTNARLMALYATRRYRALSYSLSAPEFHGLVVKLFDLISSTRDVLGAFFSLDHTAELKRQHCDLGGCGT